MENKISSVKLLDAVTATGAGLAHQPWGSKKTFHAVGTTSAGAGAATILIQVSDVVSPAAGSDVDWITLATITLTLATTQSGDGVASDSAWRHVRGKVTAISGTTATVSLYMGA